MKTIVWQLLCDSWKNWEHLPGQEKMDFKSTFGEVCERWIRSILWVLEERMWTNKGWILQNKIYLKQMKCFNIKAQVWYSLLHYKKQI